MGIHISLMRDVKDHPDWDFLRVVNDKDFPDLINWDKIIENPNNVEEFRPINLDALRERINSTQWTNKERYLRLVDLIEKNPDYWVSFSY